MALEPLVLNAESNLAEYNVHAILADKSARSGAGAVVRSSSIATESKATRRLIELTLRVGGTGMCGGGAGGYQEDGIRSPRLASGLPGFRPDPMRNEGADFIPELSVIDALMQLC
jgi:hypothetical protein